MRTRCNTSNSPPQQRHRGDALQRASTAAFADNMKRKEQLAEFPAATIAFYGPDNRHATKVVVGILPNPTADVDPIRKWMSGSTDVRSDERIGKEIQSFLDEHGVKQVVGVDRIIGCPHEAGQDFPEGMKCPLCSFWSHRDRFTHELEQ